MTPKTELMDKLVDILVKIDELRSEVAILLSQNIPTFVSKENPEQNRPYQHENYYGGC